MLLLGWLGTSSPVPIYDGVGMPDEPYRFVVPPAGYRATPPVTPARTAIQLDAGRSCCELEARSAEQGPQVAVYVPRGGLASTGSGVLSVSAEAAAPPAGPAPVEDGVYEGNAYLVTATGPAGPATLTPEGSRATVQLRALDGNTPGPAVWFRTDDAAAWRELPTGKVGLDIYEAQFVGPGSYVLVRGPEGGTGQTTTILLGILAVPALLVVVLLVLRLRGGPPRDPDEEAPDALDGEDAADTIDGDGTARPGGGDPAGTDRR